MTRPSEKCFSDGLSGFQALQAVDRQRYDFAVHQAEPPVAFAVGVGGMVYATEGEGFVVDAAEVMRLPAVGQVFLPAGNFACGGCDQTAFARALADGLPLPSSFAAVHNPLFTAGQKKRGRGKCPGSIMRKNSMSPKTY